MKISVVIPLYNKALHIERAIISIVNQSFQAREIIIIDDGSTDNSYQIVATFLKKNNMIKLFSQNNQGASYTRNKGVELTESDYVAFLDADDEWKPDFLENITRLHNNFPDCGAYATSYEIITENGEKKYPEILEVPPAPWMGIIPNLFKMMQGGSPFFTSSIVINKKVFQLLNGFPVGVKRGEDKILWIKLGIEQPIAYYPAPCVVYHQDASNRATKIFEREIDPILFLEQIIGSKVAPTILIKELDNYCTLLKLQHIGNLVINGKSQSIRKMLSSIKHNKKYQKKWFLWSFLSKIQYPILKKMRKK